MGKFDKINMYMEYKKIENLREIEMKKKAPNSNQKKKISIKNLKYSKKIISYKNKQLYELLRIIISSIYFTLIFTKSNQNILFNLTEVTLKVKGVGYIKILSDYFFQRYNQCEIYINGILQNITNNSYYLNHTENEDIDQSNNMTYLNNLKIIQSYPSQYIAIQKD